MAEDTTTVDEGTETGTEQAGDEWETSTGKGGKQAVLAELSEARKARRIAERELQKIREANQTEQERAIAEAEQRGRTSALSESGPRLVRAEFRAAAANRLDKETLDAYLEDVDLRKFLGDDGEPDVKAIEARIAKLGGARQTDFDGGARTSAAKPTDMNALIRRQAGLG